MADSNWTRWIHSSVADFFSDLATANSLPSLIEGIDDRDDVFMSAPNRVEVRVNGPFTREISKDYYQIFVDINCLFTSQMGGAAVNAYKLDESLGVYHEAMDGNIPIFRLGTGLDDDGLLLGCLTPRPGKNDLIRVLHFGQIDSTDRVRQAMVDARYVMYLT